MGWRVLWALTLLWVLLVTAQAVLDSEIEKTFWAAFKSQQRGDFAAAAEGYQRCLQVAPNMSDANHLLGVSLHQLGKSQQGLVFVRRSLELRPVFTTAYNNLGNILFTLGLENDANRAFEIAIEQNGTNVN